MTIDDNDENREMNGHRWMIHVRDSWLVIHNSVKRLRDLETERLIDCLAKMVRMNEGIMEWSLLKREGERWKKGVDVKRR